ncbi:unnamed protein product [Clonostachys rhizophaga]|uniref:Transcription factor domain-containing protein n=1 Tax=Clonostachys rhizophaga TaxID=160324 RepID=A0A9N9VHJ1_9HYPO|nr:unnamed protein product [Clonostachys rhizophaga]
MDLVKIQTDSINVEQGFSTHSGMLHTGYFTHLSEDLFPAFLNVRLIELMPDIIGLPNVHLDASICVVYYCILYHGCLLHRQSALASEDVETRSKLYHHCLRALLAWEPYATGTATDFVAAFSMVRVAAERFELELSWTMFRRACQYAEKIELHRLDNSVGSGLSSLGSSVLEASRKGFWELVGMDLYFHLIHDKPPAIVGAAQYDAQVSLPWVTALGLQQSEEAETEEITTLRFLIDSRRSFILMEFLQLLENTKVKPDPELVSKTEALCHKIEALYEQWEVDEWVKKMIVSDGQLWTLAGLAMEGYICILFMLRHAITTANFDTMESETIDIEVARLPLTLKVSRHILQMVDLLLNAMPFMATVSVTFAVLQAHLPYAYLVTNLLYSTTTHSSRGDAALLKRVFGGLKVISRNVVELEPLTAAIERLNMMVSRRLLQDPKEGL